LTSETTTRFVAFLRAINVGGRRVKMDRLREVFEGLGFGNVETFIASGNVIFDFPEADVQALEPKIEARLREALGYEVATFVRSVDELSRVASYNPFGPADPEEGSTLSVAFPAKPPREDGAAKLVACATEIDAFRVEGREVYWLCRGKTSDSAFSGATLERTLGAPATMRNITTIRKLAAKYPAVG
jgi:uncharacterized protein (DUF1697 family)